MDNYGQLELLTLQNKLFHPPNDSDELLRSGMAQFSKWVEGEKQFKYNGKEYDPMHGLNEYDYGARQYDPAISKFTTMDPLCEKYYHISTYAYCGGDPINRIDPNGKDWYKYNGQYQWRDSFDPYYTDKDGNKWERVKYHNFINRKTNSYDDVEFEQVSSSFWDMYPKRKNESFLKMRTPYVHHILYGEDSGNGVNAIITQVNDFKNASAVISKKFEPTIRNGLGLVNDKGGIGLVFTNKSGKDIVNILFSQTTGEKNRAYYQKLVEYYINKQ